MPEATGALTLQAGRDIAFPAAHLRAGTGDTAVPETSPDSDAVPLAATTAGTLTLSAGRDLSSATLTTTDAGSAQWREGVAWSLAANYLCPSAKDDPRASPTADNSNVVTI